MIKGLAVISTIGMLSAGGIAYAADLPARTAALAPAPVFAPVFTWTGFYIGAHVGGAWRSDKCRSFVPESAEGEFNEDFSGWPAGCGHSGDRRGSFMGGVQAGYNIQTGAFVFGVEADVSALGNGGRRGGLYIDATEAEPGYIKGIYVGDHRRGDDGNWLGTLRLRLGLAANQALFYVTGGLAFGDRSDRRGSISYWNGGDPDLTDDPRAIYVPDRRRGSDNVGWALGAGVEYAFNNNWSMKAEYLHARIGREKGGAYTCVAVSGAGCNPVNNNGVVFYDRGGDHGGINIVRVGLNYRFGAPVAAPVVAAY